MKFWTTLAKSAKKKGLYYFAFKKKKKPQLTCSLKIGTRLLLPFQSKLLKGDEDFMGNRRKYLDLIYYIFREYETERWGSEKCEDVIKVFYQPKLSLYKFNNLTGTTLEFAFRLKASTCRVILWTLLRDSQEKAGGCITCFCLLSHTNQMSEPLNLEILKSHDELDNSQADSKGQGVSRNG